MRVVTTSLDYADFLAATLPSWRALLPVADIVVVTAPQDVETQDVARAHGARLIVTDVWKRAGAVFNKGEAIDQGFLSGPIRNGDLCLSIDADCFLLGAFPRSETVEADTIYGVARHQATSPEQLSGHIAGWIPRAELPVIGARFRGHEPEISCAIDRRQVASRCLGYFQLFRFSSARRFGWSKSAGKCDLVFRDQFPRRGVLDDLYCVHLGTSTRRNWSGRVVPLWGEPVEAV